MAKSYGAGRTRNYVTILYPDSMSSDYLDIIQKEAVPAFLSPLHDKDVNADGQPKKAHYHFLVMYDGVKSIEQAQEFFKRLGGVGCEKVSSLRGQARYLCHLDNPDKFQYPIEDVKCFSGADYRLQIGLQSDKYQCIRDMMAWCVENQVYSYAHLLMYRSTNNESWFRCLCDSSTLVIKEFLVSLNWSERQNENRKG